MLMRNARGGARSARQREEEWRRLQAQNSKEHRKSAQATRKLKMGLGLAFVGFLMLVSHVFPGFLGAESSDAAKEGAIEAKPADQGGQVTAGISLDHLGETQLRNPMHKLCGTAALYFVEARSDFRQLSRPLQGGTVLAQIDAASEDDCCNACAAQDCPAFRFQAATCTMLRIDPSAAAPEENRLRGDFATGLGGGAPPQREEPKIPRDSVHFGAEHNPAVHATDDDDLEPAGVFLGDRETADDDEGETDNVVAGEDEEPEGEDPEQLEGPDEEEDEDEETDASPEEGEEDDNVEDPEGVGEEVEEEDNEDDEEETAVQTDEDAAGDGDDDEELAALFSSLGGKSSGIDADDAEDPFKDLENFDDDFTFDAGRSEDDGLLEELMQEAKDRINPRPLRPEEIEAARLAALRESLKEVQSDPAKLEDLGKKGLRDILPPGDYNRLTARDPIYGKHKGIFLRYRSQREILAVAKELADHYKDVELVEIGDTADKKKPQPIMSLRVGNGRRGKHVFILGTLKGCEWTSSMGILHTAMAIKGRGETTKALLDAVQFHFVMISNPGGFDYSHLHTPSSARSWCKNRRVAVSGSHGVDLETNWGLDGISWGFGKRLKEGAKLDSFQGPANFSEPETQALRNYMAHYATGRGRIAVMHVKCCSGVITPPQIYRAIEKPIDINLIAGRLAIQMERTDGTKYSVTTRENEFNSKNHGQLIDYTYNELEAELSLMVDVKASALSTRQDATKIAIDPFQTLLRELETASVFMAQKLLRVPTRGDPVDVPYTKLPADPFPIVQGGKRKRKK